MCCLEVCDTQHAKSGLHYRHCPCTQQDSKNGYIFKLILNA